MGRRTLIRGGCVLTLGNAPNLPRGDVLIEDDRVAEVGPAIRARDAEVLDATDAVVLPGFVDAHRHAAASLVRNRDEDASLEADLRPTFGAEELYVATLAGLLGAAEAGITAVGDWCGLAAEDERVEACLQAHAEAGLRSVLVVEPAGAESAWSRIVALAGSTTTIAMGWRPGTSGDRLQAVLTGARALGLRAYVHADARAPAEDWLEADEARASLGPDVAVLHATALPRKDIEVLAAAGSRVVLTPASDMACGLGPPPVQDLLDHGIPPALGTDRERAAPGDPFAPMRGAISWQHALAFERKLAGMAGVPRLMTTRDVIRSATVEGARALGLEGTTGTLEPGMQADLIVLATDLPNIYPVNDPVGAVVWGMDTSNLRHAFVAGRPIVRDGALAADVGRVRAEVERVRRALAGTGGRGSPGGEG